MDWCEQLVQKLSGQQIVNDSKTPSGRAHVGALRGVLIHDAVFRACKRHGTPVRYIFGVDDYDPLDELPAGEADQFRKYLGQPLCNVPPPQGSTFSDMAEHYIQDFFSVFADLGVTVERYRLRDIYRSGQFNAAIDKILSHGEVVREIYRTVSGAERPSDWLPFQVICENCSRIGTTIVHSYDGRIVRYSCSPTLVKWAQGCGHSGSVSPFDGRGKLPWKLEWTAKWATMGITVEGAGEDHTVKGGSREVAAECLRRIFEREPPVNIPYGFIRVGGAKMSSSRGLGVSARDVADFLPAEIIRFLMLSTPPRRPVNFEPTLENLTKIFSDFDRTYVSSHKAGEAARLSQSIMQLVGVDFESGLFLPDFPLVTALIQLPHLDPIRQLAAIKGAELTPREAEISESRIRAARYWLERFAEPADRLVVQNDIPARASELTAAQRHFLHVYSELLATLPQPWQATEAQYAAFDAARRTPIDQPAAFKAIYRVLFDRDAGPKAGNVLSFLSPQFVIDRFRALPVSQRDLWLSTAGQPESVLDWLKEVAATVTSLTWATWDAHAGADTAAGAESPARPEVVQIEVALADGRSHVRRASTAAQSFIDEVERVVPGRVARQLKS